MQIKFRNPRYYSLRGLGFIWTNRQTDREIDRQTNIQIDKQTDRQTEGQTLCGPRRLLLHVTFAFDLHKVILLFNRYEYDIIKYIFLFYLLQPFNFIILYFLLSTDLKLVQHNYSNWKRLINLVSSQGSKYSFQHIVHSTECLFLHFLLPHSPFCLPSLTPQY